MVFINCELISAPEILLIKIPLSLSLDYHSHVYSMHDPNRYVDLRRCQNFKNKKLAVISL
jgi:hypothetical protein